MTESTARAALFELQSSKFPFYLWAVPQKPVCVRIPFPVIDRLENEAVENFRSLSSKGSEIGGLLFGNVSPGQPSEVTIEDYELISCDYSRGPLYRLADADMGRFDRSILQHGSAGSLAVVGFFRSHTRKNLSLDADDLGFFDARFRDPHQIALLIRPLATKASTAGIFIRENGIVQPDASCLEFPFRSSLLTPEPPRAEPVESKPAAPSPAPAPPAPATGRNVARGQIVPIASRREVGSAMPAPSVEPAILARTPVEPAAPASGSATARMASPAVSDPPKPPPHAPAPQSPASKLDDKVARPKPEDKTNKPQVEEKVAKPKVEDKAAAKSKPEDKAAVRPQVEDRSAAKPKVEDKVTPVKSIYTATAAAPVEEPAKARSKRLWIVLGAGALLTLVIAFFVYPPLLHRNRPSGAAQDSSQLSLRVERTAGEILLTWNRDATAIRTATHAVLSISDGDQHENVEMDLPQLRNGSISYSPASSDVVFKMEVTGHGNEKTASESVRVLRTKPLPMAPAETTQQAGQTPAKGAPAVSTPQPNTPQSNSAPSPAANPGNTAAAPATPDPEPPAPEVTQAKATKAFQAPLAQRLHPANPADLPDAPSLGRVENSSVPNVAGFNMNSVTAPVAPPKPGNPSPSAPAEKKANTGGQITQAVLVSRKDPEYPKLARETGAKGIVELLATIGIDGRVKAVKVVHGPPMLIKAASDAVLQWKYKPTILNGVAVEATTQVFVNFLGGDR